LYKLIKPILFSIDPERAHGLTLSLFRVASRIPVVKSLFKAAYAADKYNKATSLFGLQFPNKVGLAAGFDKDGKYMDLMSTLGFGFLEMGTVTPKAQKGNEQPRLFRLKQDEALINRMGFNNEGVDFLVERLKAFKRTEVIIGGNIGKNKITPNEEAVNDYLICFEKLFDWVDYFVVNVSSPNTPGLRALQEKEPLKRILQSLQDVNAKKEKRKPILLKIAPDLSNEQLDDVIEIIFETELDGLIATNTTIDRTKLTTEKATIEGIGNGGMSGAPLNNRSTEVISYIAKKSEGKIPIIGVGGINSASTAKEKLAAGASLVQIYSGMIYEGPTLIGKIKKSLS